MKIEQANLVHLLPELGRKLVCDLEAARDFPIPAERDWTKMLHPKTVNLESRNAQGDTVNVLANGHGSQPEVKMLDTRDDVGRAITLRRGIGLPTGLW